MISESAFALNIGRVVYLHTASAKPPVHPPNSLRISHACMWKRRLLFVGVTSAHDTYSAGWHHLFVLFALRSERDKETVAHVKRHFVCPKCHSFFRFPLCMVNRR